MERVEFLVRRFRQIAPQPLSGWDPVANRRLVSWLRDDVGPVLAGLVARPAFRQQASWPLRTLRPGVGTPQRQLVDSVDAALVGHAQALTRLDGFPSPESLRAQADRGPAVPSDQQEATLDLLQVHGIAARFWRDLVCPEDYFEPTGGWMERQPAGGQPAEFIVSLNPELHAGGDFVSRCLIRRAEVLADALRRALSFVSKSRQDAGLARHNGWATAGEEYRQLRATLDQLREACLGGPDQPLRDACVLLTQAHAALQPGADLGWLGLPPAAVQNGRAAAGYRLLQRCDGELLERVAAALGQLPRLYAGQDAPAEALDEAIATGGLVLVREPPRVFWQGREVEATWSRYPARWRFWQMLVEKGYHGQALERRHLPDAVIGLSTLATQFSRVKELLPASLWKHVVPSSDPRGYRLTLERRLIHLF